MTEQRKTLLEIIDLINKLSVHASILENPSATAGIYLTEVKNGLMSLEGMMKKLVDGQNMTQKFIEDIKAMNLKGKVKERFDDLMRRMSNGEDIQKELAGVWIMVTDPQ
jgi:hypothetical protein